MESRSAVLEVSGVNWAASKAVAESVLKRRPGGVDVEMNPVAQAATGVYDPAVTSVATLAGWVRDCGYRCAGRSVPDHLCDPFAEVPAKASDAIARLVRS
jgi:Cu2+-exporting ATPase